MCLHQAGSQTFPSYAAVVGNSLIEPLVPSASTPFSTHSRVAQPPPFENPFANPACATPIATLAAPFAGLPGFEFGVSPTAGAACTPASAPAASAFPPEVRHAMEVIGRWREEHGPVADEDDPHEDDPHEDDPHSHAAASVLAPEDIGVPSSRSSRSVKLPDTVSSYVTLSIKSAQIDSIAKLNVGKGESHLNWWFDFSGQLEALNLDAVARSGLTSHDRRHVCGPIAQSVICMACAKAPSVTTMRLCGWRAHPLRLRLRDRLS